MYFHYADLKNHAQQRCWEPSCLRSTEYELEGLQISPHSGCVTPREGGSGGLDPQQAGPGSLQQIRRPTGTGQPRPPNSPMGQRHHLFFKKEKRKNNINNITSPKEEEGRLDFIRTGTSVFIARDCSLAGKRHEISIFSCNLIIITLENIIIDYHD